MSKKCSLCKKPIFALMVCQICNNTMIVSIEHKEKFTEPELDILKSCFSAKYDLDENKHEEKKIEHANIHLKHKLRKW